MIYDLAYVGFKPNTLGPVLARLPETVPASVRNGALLGCFLCELGALNRVAILSAYESVEHLQKDRAALVGAENPYGIAEIMSSFDRCAYKPLPFASDIAIDAYGPFYEIRTYGVAHGGLPATAEAWAKVVPRRNEISKLLMVMGSIDPGPIRMAHIYPYPALDGRTAARAQASKEGIWPPPGGSDHITSLQSELFIAMKFSPMQ